MASFHRWLANLLDSRLELGRKQRRPRGRARLALEALEDRAVPAALVAPGTEAAYVRNLYAEVLVRTGSAGEVAGYAADLQAGRSPDSVAAAFLGSAEYHTRRVDELYRGTLGRPADASSQGFVALLQRGGTEREVLTGLLNSAEYNARHPDNASFVESLYKDVLGRSPSAGEAASYQGHLASGRSRSELVGAFLNSPERARVEVNGLFTLYLGRAADEPSLANMATALAQGASSLRQLAVTIVSSAENQLQAIATPPAPTVTPPTVTPPTDAPPSVQRASSANSTTVRVTFSEDVADSAADPARYQITQQGAALNVASARFVAGKSVVELTTAEQNDGSYSLTITGVTDLAGNALTGGAAAFTGIPSPLDTDGDGLSDFLERRGYQITVTAANGTQTQRQVSSDPTKADTDADGLDDSREKALLTDPGAPDTDGDGIGDRAEVTARTVTFVAANGSPVSRQVTSDPTKQDTDADGLTDAQEAVLAADPSAADTDADGVTDSREGQLGTDALKADTDADDLTDGDELAGWDVTVRKLNGAVVTRHVTSDPTRPDTDADGLDDRHEKTLGTDPRAGDTDADTLADKTEVTQTRTDPTSQDSDRDGIDDATEANQAAPPPADVTAPRVLSVVSTANDKVLVTFSEPMGPSALVTTNYVVQQQNVNPEAGTLVVTAARFTDANGAAVELTTRSQSEVIYAVTVAGTADRAGNPLAASVRVNFPGTPPAGMIDSDSDGLPDSVEQRGWVVTVRLSDGTTTTRQVSSDPTKADTDGDGLTDAAELAVVSDPRNADTDADGLSDATEVHRYRSNPTRQDTDGDGLDDAREVNVLFTSPLLTDTDGDQISDNAELLGNRNPRVSDLPTPRIDVGDVSLKLNVKLTATSAQGSRDLETKEARSVLENNSVRETSQVSEVTSTAQTKFGFSQTLNLQQNFLLFDSAKGPALSFGSTQEFTNTTANRSAFTNVSRQETKRALTNARTTTMEVTATETVVRTVDAARIDTTLDLTNLSDVSYRIRNLQVTALMADPNDPTSLVPVATLVPDKEPADGFVLGPLSASRGPIVMTSQTVFPSLVESLMENPQGLIFKLSNYDVIDEKGRNFAFSSQEVVERTGSLTLDFSGAQRPTDPVQPNAQGVEVHRVATSAGRTIDGVRTAYGPGGGEAGVTLRQALSAIGLTGYQVRADAAGKVLRDAAGQVRYFDAAGNQVALTAAQISNSYATFQTRFSDGSQAERFYRIRDRAIVEGQPEAWEIITDTGIDRTLGPDTVILKAGTSATLAFVRDEDGDSLPSGLEDLYGTSDTKKDTDGDGLDDRFEALIGYDVNVPGRGLIHVQTSPTLADTDEDGLSDRDEAPAAFFDADGDGLIDPGELTSNFQILVTDNSLTNYTALARADVNGDGQFQANEIFPLRSRVTDRNGSGTVSPFTNPALIEVELFGLYATDSNGNGFLDRPGGAYAPGEFTDYVTNPLEADTDGDLLSDREEVTGVEIRPIDAPNSPFLTRTAPSRSDTDSDGVIDGLEKLFGLNPADGLDRDTDGDGLPDRVEQFGWLVPYEQVTDAPLEVKAGEQFVAAEFDVATGFRPVSTDPAQDVVVLNVNLPTGTLVRLAAPTGGLFAGTDYYLSNRGGNTYEFYTSQAAALSASGALGSSPGVVDLTGDVTDRLIVGVSKLSRVRPDVTKADTDGDGLSDFEEYRLKTLPADEVITFNGQTITRRGIDSDADGISDFDEVRGFKLAAGRDQTPVTLNPLDADSDNDGLSDGEEAEIDLDANGKRIDRGFAGRWIVNVVGEAPRRVFSDPRDPDADFDLLPDGAEKYQVVGGGYLLAGVRPARVFQGSDPTKANTDGDAANDFEEVRRGTNPVLKGFMVTLTIGTLTFNSDKTDNDGDDNSLANTNLNGAGDIGLSLFIRRPDDAAADFLGTQDTYFTTNTTGFLNSVPISVGAANSFSGFPLNRSITFEVGLNQTFAFGGMITEWDNDFFTNDLNDRVEVALGDATGVQVTLDSAKRAAVLTGFDLDQLFTGDVQRSVRKDLLFDFAKSDNTSPKGAAKGDSDKMAGKLTISMLVTR